MGRSSGAGDPGFSWNWVRFFFQPSASQQSAISPERAALKLASFRPEKESQDRQMGSGIFLKMASFLTSYQRSAISEWFRETT
jgi:hypothetical protein